MEKNKAFIFDMDGTMVDNMLVHQIAWQQLLLEMGYDWTIEEIKERIAGKNEEIFKKVFPNQYSDAEIDALASKKEEQYRSVFGPQAKLIDGLEDFFAYLKSKNYAMGIGTAAPIENAQFLSDLFDLKRFFNVMITAKDVTFGKPNPEVFLKVADLLHIAPENCTVFEDSPVGAQAAQRAGMQCVIILTNHKRAEFEPYESNISHFIEDYHSIAQLLQI